MRYGRPRVAVRCWIAAIAVLLGILAHSANAFATAGEKVAIDCCCPRDEVCKCQDHVADHEGERMGRCGRGVRVDLPALDTGPVAVTVECEVPASAPAVCPAAPLPLEDGPERAFEPPPF